jgi:hypothetical protein
VVKLDIRLLGGFMAWVDAQLLFVYYIPQFRLTLNGGLYDPHLLLTFPGHPLGQHDWRSSSSAGHVKCVNHVKSWMAERSGSEGIESRTRIAGHLRYFTGITIHDSRHPESTTPQLLNIPSTSDPHFKLQAADFEDGSTCSMITINIASEI